MFFAEILAYLKENGTLAYTRFAAQEHKRALYKSAAENTVKLTDARIIAYICICAYIFKFEYIVAETVYRLRSSPFCNWGAVQCFFFKAVPGSAGGTFSVPFGAFVSALIADVNVT